jgi:hypothetical protein
VLTAKRLFRTFPGRLLFWAAVIVAVYTVIGFLLVPLALKAALPSRLSESLHRQVTIERVRFNPYTLNMTARGLRVDDRPGKGTFAHIEEVFLSLKVSSLFRRALVLDQARIVKPSLTLVRLKDGSYNFQDLLKTRGAAPTRFSLNNVRITGGSIDFRDLVTGSQHSVRNMTVNVPFISNIPYYADTYIHPLFTADVDGARYEIKGQSKPFSKSLETEVTLAASRIELARYLSYLPPTVRIKVPSGLLNLDIRASYRQSEAKPPTLFVAGRTVLEDLAVNDPDDRPLVQVPRMEIELAGAELFARDVNIARLAIMSPRLAVVRTAGAGLNLLSIVSPGEGVPAKKAAGPRPLPFSLRVGECVLSSGRLTVTDNVPPEPFTAVLDPVDFRLSRFSTGTGEGAPFSLSLNTAEKGRVDITGQVQMSPLSVRAETVVQNVALAPFQPYMPPSVKLVVERGVLSAKGRLSCSQATAGGLNFNYEGNLSSRGFSSTDPATGNRFLAWKSFSAEAVSASSSPPAFRSGRLFVGGTYVRLDIGEDGTLNVQHILKGRQEGGRQGATASAGEGPAQQKAPEMQIEIGSMTLRNGTADFSDHYIKPPYSARLTGLSGTISPISSQQGKPARIDIKGQVNNYAPLQVTGSVDLFRPDERSDVTASVSGLDLTSMSPYSAHFVGYRIQRGTLTLNAKYLLSNKELQADNRAGLARFALGECVESHPVIDLPIKLVISILKDREGNINLEVPISGNLSNPHFSFRDAVVGAIKNLVEKIVTSPLSFLGSLFGSQEKDLGYVEFPYGSSDVPPAAKGKLDLVTKAMLDRPEMRLNVAGYADAQADRDALKQRRFLNLLKAQKMKGLPGKEGKPVDWQDVEITPAEYTKYLEKAYHAAKIQKPKNILGLDKGVPPDEMEKLLRGSIAITDQDCIALALDRAVKVRSSLLASGQIGNDRLVVTESDPLKPPDEKDVKKSRVEFGLQG